MSVQYFQQTTGTIESFNFGEYLNNLDYAICIERQPSTCRVIYSASDFLWSIDSAQDDKTRSAAGDNGCPYDYLMIPGGSQTGDGLTLDRYCGGKLHYGIVNQIVEAPVVSKANGPIVLRFHSDAVQDETVKDGFRLRYEQSSTECMPQYSSNSLFGPTPVVSNAVAAQYIADKPLSKQESLLYSAKAEPHVRSNAKQSRFWLKLSKDSKSKNSMYY